MHFANNIRYIRRRKNKTQGQIAELLGIKRGAYAAYEEKRAEPPFKVLIAISRELKYYIDDLLTKDLTQP